VHGGAQNAHTFDTVALAMGRPLLAVDLPGHGHSDPAPRGNADSQGHARDLAALCGALGLAHLPIAGMSLGGIVAMLATAGAPQLASRLAMIDITPGVTDEKAHRITAFVNGPKAFADLDELVARTIEHNPTRSEQSLRRGVLHNAVQQDDGTWVWRHQQHAPPESPAERPDTTALWAALAAVAVPTMLVRAMGPGSVVDDADESEFLRVQPAGAVVHVENSGHSIQGDQPLELAKILDAFISAP
jgi:pimeloyl-ACP methyl ester carboxylesterase